MNIEITVDGTCSDCDVSFSSDDLHALCGSCLGSYGDEYFELALKYSSDQAWEWENKDSYVGFKDDDDLNTYLLGVKKGYQAALFWMAEYAGKTDFFEKDINEKFHPMKNFIQ